MKSRLLVSMISLAGFAIPFAPAAAAAPRDPQPISAPADEEMKELKKRFESRYPMIRDLKAAGTAGETSEGYLDFVKDNPGGDAAKLVEEENSDRRRLYELIAQKEGVSSDVVAKRNAQRNFEKAKKGEWIKKDGKWEQK